MTNEFINVYVQKQKTLIAELQAKLLIAEAQLEVTTSYLDKANKENEALKEEVEKLNSKKQKGNTIGE
jgi:cell division protein FtsB